MRTLALSMSRVFVITSAAALVVLLLASAPVAKAGGHASENGDVSEKPRKITEREIHGALSGFGVVDDSSSDEGSSKEYAYISDDYSYESGKVLKPLLNAELLTWITEGNTVAMRGLDWDNELDLKGQKGAKLLKAAIMAHSVYAVEELLKHETDPNVSEKSIYHGKNMTPLIQAVYERNPAAVKLLLRHRADQGIVMPNGESALSVAVRLGEYTVVSALLQQSGNLPTVIKDKIKDEVQKYVLPSGDLGLYSLLARHIHQLANLECTEELLGPTKAFLAAVEGCKKAEDVKVAFNDMATPPIPAPAATNLRKPVGDSGSGPTCIPATRQKKRLLAIRDEAGHFAIWGALQCPDDGVLAQILIDSGARFGSDDLVRAAVYGHTRVVKAMFEKGVKLHMQDQKQQIRIAVFYAVSKYNFEMFSMLLKNGASAIISGVLFLSYHNSDHTRSLLGIALDGVKTKTEEALKMVAALLEHNVDPNLCGNYETLPLIVAVENDNSQLLSMLLKAKANPNLTYAEVEGHMIQDWTQQTTVHGDKEYFNVKTGKRYPHKPEFSLPSTGADIWLSWSGVTPLTLAVERENYDAVDLLIRYSAKINEANIETGDTPLMLAVKADDPHDGIVRALLSGGADVNQANSKTGDTPLILAVKARKVGHVSALLKRGATPDEELQQLACSEKDLRVAELLLQKAPTVGAWNPTCMAAFIASDFAPGVKYLLERGGMKLSFEFPKEKRYEPVEGKSLFDAALSSGKSKALLIMVDMGVPQRQDLSYHDFKAMTVDSFAILAEAKNEFHFARNTMSELVHSQIRDLNDSHSSWRIGFLNMFVAQGGNVDDMVARPEQVIQHSQESDGEGSSSFELPSPYSELPSHESSLVTLALGAESARVLYNYDGWGASEVAIRGWLAAGADPCLRGWPVTPLATHIACALHPNDEYTFNNRLYTGETFFERNINTKIMKSLFEAMADRDCLDRAVAPVCGTYLSRWQAGRNFVSWVEKEYPAFKCPDHPSKISCPFPSMGFFRPSPLPELRRGRRW